MLLKLLTWNINFIYDNWTERLTNINTVLEKEINEMKGKCKDLRKKEKKLKSL